jgi:hypothetical protein
VIHLVITCLQCEWLMRALDEATGASDNAYWKERWNDVQRVVNMALTGHVDSTLWKVSGRRIDGSPVSVLMRDWGDSRPAHDARGLVYEAYQTEWQIDGVRYFAVLDKSVVENALHPNQVGHLRLTADYAFLESVGIDGPSLDFEGKTMALMGQEGETHSHLNPARERADAAAPGTGHPDRGHRVGHGVGRDYVRMSQGEPLALDRPQSTLPPRVEEAYRKYYQGKLIADASMKTQDIRRVDEGLSDLELVRVTSLSGIQYLLEHQPMVESQRRILVQALGVLDSFA